MRKKNVKYIFTAILFYSLVNNVLENKFLLPFFLTFLVLTLKTKLNLINNFYGCRYKLNQVHLLHPTNRFQYLLSISQRFFLKCKKK